MKVLRVLLAALVTACGLVLVAPVPPAAACSCKGGNAVDYAGWADVVFAGTLASTPQASGRAGAAPEVTYRFDVETIYKGDTSSSTEVDSMRGCGLEGMAVGQTYLMFASLDRGRLESGLCSGNGPATNRYAAEVEQFLGVGHRPSAGATDARIGAPAGTPTVGYVLLGFSAVGIVVVLWVLLAGRRSVGRSA